MEIRNTIWNSARLEIRNPIWNSAVIGIYEEHMTERKALENCTLCPRACKVDRLSGERGVCGTTGETVLLSRAALHFWEEPAISGTKGSGAVFFSGCNLRCAYCQNRDIANCTIGKEVSVARLSEIFLELQEKGAENINLVTPTHYASQIREAVLLAREKGLAIPTVYNTGGYESAEILSEMEDVIDIYLTDFKYMDETLSKGLSKAADYPEVAKRALAEMVRQKPECSFDEAGMMKRGVIVRNLLLPGHVNNSKKVVEYVYNTYGDAVYLSLMNQYTPLREIDGYPELNRKVTEREYKRLLDFALALGVTNAYIQEGKT